MNTLREKEIGAPIRGRNPKLAYPRSVSVTADRDGLGTWRVQGCPLGRSKCEDVDLHDQADIVYLVNEIILNVTRRRSTMARQVLVLPLQSCWRTTLDQNLTLPWLVLAGDDGRWLPLLDDPTPQPSLLPRDQHHRYDKYSSG